MDSTIRDRTKLRNELGKKMAEWLKMDDAELLAYTKVVWPMVASATREEMLRASRYLKFLVLDHVRDVPGLRPREDEARAGAPAAQPA